MEPFSISCTTCQARLRVRDSSAIGQILACPKCGSMVMIHGPNGETVAPTADTPPTTDETPSTVVPAATANASPEPPPAETEPTAGEGNTAPGSNTVSGERPLRTFKFREDYVPATDPPVLKTPRGPRISDPPKSAGPTVTAPPTMTDAMSAPDATPAADGSSRLRQWLWLGGAAVAGVTLALLLVTFVASRIGTSATDVVQVPGAEPEAPEKSVAPSDVASSAQQPPAGDTATVKPPPGAVEPDAAKAADEPDSPAPKADPAAEAPADDAPAADDVATAKTDDGGKTPPGSADSATAPADADAASDAHTGMETVKPNDDKTEAAKPETAEPTVGQADAISAAGWSVPIRALTLHDAPLFSLADFAADFANVPVSCDVDAMLIAGISPDTKLDVDQQDITMADVLRAALEPVGLKYVVRDEQIVIVPQRDVNQEVQRTSYDVADLADNDEQTQALAKLIVKFIAPESWIDQGGSATLTVGDQSLDIEQTEAGQFHVARFLDRLRATRGLLPRSELPDELVDVAPAFVRAGSELQNPVSASFPEPTDVVRILKYLSGETNMRLIVDWPSTVQVDWGRPTKSILVGEDQPLSKLLDTWLGPAQLGYRVIDNKTIQITSLSALDSRPELEVYPLKGDTEQNVAQTVQDLKLHLGPALFADGGGKGDVIFEPISGTLIVSLPQPQQRKAAEWLSTADKLRVTPNASAQ